MNETLVQNEVVFCWSGGKDSAMALHALQGMPGYRVTSLLTTVTEEYDRISMHGVRCTLLERQAESLGLPLHKVLIPPRCVNAQYESQMEAALTDHLAHGVRHVAFGDIFLEDLRVYRERNLEKAGMEAVFPIWKRDTGGLAADFLRLGFRAIAVCVDPRVLAPSFAGRELDQSFFADLPSGVDPCGENGEFHTFVFTGPVFKDPIRLRVGEKVMRDGFCFCDLLPD